MLMVKIPCKTVVHTVKFTITEIARNWDFPSFLLFQAQKVGQSLLKWDSWLVCSIADNQHNLEKKLGQSKFIRVTDNGTNGGG